MQNRDDRAKRNAPDDIDSRLDKIFNRLTNKYLCPSVYQRLLPLLEDEFGPLHALARTNSDQEEEEEEEEEDSDDSDCMEVTPIPPKSPVEPIQDKIARVLKRFAREERLTILVVSLHPPDRGYVISIRNHLGTEREAVTVPYDEPEILTAIGSGEVPAALFDLLDALDVDLLYQGRMICELRDYRSADKDGPPKIQVSLLEPPAQAVSMDLRALCANSDLGYWKKAQLESKLILLQAGPICLDPNYKGPTSSRASDIPSVKRVRQALTWGTEMKRMKIAETEVRPRPFALRMLEMKKKRLERKRRRAGSLSCDVSMESIEDLKEAHKKLYPTPLMSSMTELEEKALAQPPPTAIAAAVAVFNRFGTPKVPHPSYFANPGPRQQALELHIVHQEDYVLEEEPPNVELPWFSEPCVPGKGKSGRFAQKISVRRRLEDEVIFVDVQPRVDLQTGLGVKTSEAKFQTQGELKLFLSSFFDVFTGKGKKSVKVTHIDAHTGKATLSLSVGANLRKREVETNPKPQPVPKPGPSSAAVTIAKPRVPAAPPARPAAPSPATPVSMETLRGLVAAGARIVRVTKGSTVIPAVRPSNSSAITSSTSTITARGAASAVRPKAANGTVLLQRLLQQQRLRLPGQVRPPVGPRLRMPAAQAQRPLFRPVRPLRPQVQTNSRPQSSPQAQQKVATAAEQPAKTQEPQKPPAEEGVFKKPTLPLRHLPESSGDRQEQFAKLVASLMSTDGTMKNAAAQSAKPKISTLAQLLAKPPAPAASPAATSALALKTLLSQAKVTNPVATSAPKMSPSASASESSVKSPAPMKSPASLKSPSGTPASPVTKVSRSVTLAASSQMMTASPGLNSGTSTSPSNSIAVSMASATKVPCSVAAPSHPAVVTTSQVMVSRVNSGLKTSSTMTPSGPLAATMATASTSKGLPSASPSPQLVATLSTSTTKPAALTPSHPVAGSLGMGPPVSPSPSNASVAARPPSAVSPLQPMAASPVMESLMTLKQLPAVNSSQPMAQSPGTPTQTRPPSVMSPSLAAGSSRITRPLPAMSPPQQMAPSPGLLANRRNSSVMSPGPTMVHSPVAGMSSTTRLLSVLSPSQAMAPSPGSSANSRPSQMMSPVPTMAHSPVAGLSTSGRPLSAMSPSQPMTPSPAAGMGRPSSAMSPLQPMVASPGMVASPTARPLSAMSPSQPMVASPAMGTPRSAASGTSSQSLVTQMNSNALRSVMSPSQPMVASPGMRSVMATGPSTSQARVASPVMNSFTIQSTFSPQQMAPSPVMETMMTAKLSTVSSHSLASSPAMHSFMVPARSPMQPAASPTMGVSPAKPSLASPQPGVAFPVRAPSGALRHSLAMSSPQPVRTAPAMNSTATLRAALSPSQPMAPGNTRSQPAMSPYQPMVASPAMGSSSLCSPSNPMTSPAAMGSSALRSPIHVTMASMSPVPAMSPSPILTSPVFVSSASSMSPSISVGSSSTMSPSLGSTFTLSHSSPLVNGGSHMFASNSPLNPTQILNATHVVESSAAPNVSLDAVSSSAEDSPLADAASIMDLLAEAMGPDIAAFDIEPMASVANNHANSTSIVFSSEAMSSTPTVSSVVTMHSAPLAMNSVPYESSSFVVSTSPAMNSNLVVNSTPALKATPIGTIGQSQGSLPNNLPVVVAQLIKNSGIRPVQQQQQQQQQQTQNIQMVPQVQKQKVLSQQQLRQLLQAQGRLQQANQRQQQLQQQQQQQQQNQLVQNQLQGQLHEIQNQQSPQQMQNQQQPVQAQHQQQMENFQNQQQQQQVHDELQKHIQRQLQQRAHQRQVQQSQQLRQLLRQQQQQNPRPQQQTLRMPAPIVPKPQQVVLGTGSGNVVLAQLPAGSPNAVFVNNNMGDASQSFQGQQGMTNTRIVLGKTLDIPFMSNALSGGGYYTTSHVTGQFVGFQPFVMTQQQQPMVQNTNQYAFAQSNVNAQSLGQQRTFAIRLAGPQSGDSGQTQLRVQQQQPQVLQRLLNSQPQQSASVLQQRLMEPPNPTRNDVRFNNASPLANPSLSALLAGTPCAESPVQQTTLHSVKSPIMQNNNAGTALLVQMPNQQLQFQIQPQAKTHVAVPASSPVNQLGQQVNMGGTNYVVQGASPAHFSVISGMSAIPAVQQVAVANAVPVSVASYPVTMNVANGSNGGLIAVPIQQGDVVDSSNGPQSVGNYIASSPGLQQGQTTYYTDFNNTQQVLSVPIQTGGNGSANQVMNANVYQQAQLKAVPHGGQNVNQNTVTFIQQQDANHYGYQNHQGGSGQSLAPCAYQGWQQQPPQEQLQQSFVGSQGLNGACALSPVAAAVLPSSQQLSHHEGAVTQVAGPIRGPVQAGHSISAFSSPVLAGLSPQERLDLVDDWIRTEGAMRYT